jgi:hypothetical protein
VQVARVCGQRPLNAVKGDGQYIGHAFSAVQRCAT